MIPKDVFILRDGFSTYTPIEIFPNNCSSQIASGEEALLSAFSWWCFLQNVGTKLKLYPGVYITPIGKILFLYYYTVSPALQKSA